MLEIVTPETKIVPVDFLCTPFRGDRMTDPHAIFDGSIPGFYDTHLSPLFFQYYAADLSRRVSVPDEGAVLEVACGTGIATGHLCNALPRNVKIVATDLNEPMLEFARRKPISMDNVTFQQADAQHLPFENSAFDAVVCQFSLMFFPDKEAALKEAARVLKPGGLLAFSVWDSFDQNSIARITHETMVSYFDERPPGFMLVPFGFHAIDPIKAMLAGAGFQKMEITVLPTVIEYPDADDLAAGLVMGNPSIHEIRERANASAEEIVTALAEKIRKEFGQAPSRIPLQAIIFSARRGGG